MALIVSSISQVTGIVLATAAATRIVVPAVLVALHPVVQRDAAETGHHSTKIRPDLVLFLADRSEIGSSSAACIRRGSGVTRWTVQTSHATETLLSTEKVLSAKLGVR